MSRSDTTAFVMPLTDVLELLETTRAEDAPPLRLRVKPDRRRTQSDWPSEKERRVWGRGSPPPGGSESSGEP
jgi:hypothetical protein